MKMDIPGLLDRVILHLFFYLVLTSSFCSTNDIVDSPLLKEVELKKALFYKRYPSIFDPVVETVHKMFARRNGYEQKPGVSNLKSHESQNGFHRYPQFPRPKPIPFNYESYASSVNEGPMLRIPILENEFSKHHDNYDYQEDDDEEMFNRVADNTKEFDYEPRHHIFSRKSTSDYPRYVKKNTKSYANPKTKYKTRYRPTDLEYASNENCDCTKEIENMHPYERRKSSMSRCPCAKSNYRRKVIGKSYTSDSLSAYVDKHHRKRLKPCTLNHKHTKFSSGSNKFPPVYSAHSHKQSPVRFLITEVESNPEHETETDENNSDDDESYSYHPKTPKPQKSPPQQPVTPQPITGPPPVQIAQELQVAPSTLQNSLVYVVSPPQEVSQTQIAPPIPVPISLPYVMGSHHSAQIINTQSPTVTYNLGMNSKTIQHVPSIPQLVSSPQYVANMPLQISQSPTTTSIMSPQSQSVLLVNNSPPPTPIVYSTPEVQQPSYAINHQPVVLQSNSYNYQTQQIAEPSLQAVSYITPDVRPLSSTLSAQPSLLLPSYGSLHQQQIEQPKIESIVPKKYVILKKAEVFQEQDVNTGHSQPSIENFPSTPDHSSYLKNSPPLPDVVHNSYNLKHQKIDDSKPLLFASNYYMQEKITSDLTAQAKQQVVNSFS